MDIGWSEILVIAVVALVVIGPKDLPKALRTFGKFTGQLRKMAGEFRKQFDDALKEAELSDLKDIKDSLTDLKKLDPTSDIRKSLNQSFSPMSSVTKSVNESAKSINSAIKISPIAAAAAAAASGTAEPGAAAVNDNSVASPGLEIVPLPIDEPVTVNIASGGAPMNGAAHPEAIDPSKRGVAQRAADAWKKAVGQDGGA